MVGLNSDEKNETPNFFGVSDLRALDLVAFIFFNSMFYISNHEMK